MASELGVQTIQHTNGTDAMTIDSSGHVEIANRIEWPDRPAFTVGYDSTSGTYASLVTSGGMSNTVPFNTVTQARNANASAGWSNSTHIFTAPIAGPYLISVWSLRQTSTDWEIGVAKNQDYVSNARFYSNSTRGISGTVLFNLAVGDEVQMYSGAAIYLDADGAYSGMSIVYMG
tara:strand:- start:51 stop:575 length:525 start_codon:yes stop_codon:yes gene_type:complete